MTMSEDDDWGPDEGLIEWAKQHFASIGVGGVWAPDESGVTYIKQDEDTFALIRMVDHPTAHEHHKRFKILYDATDFSIIDSDDMVIVPPAMNLEEHSRQELLHNKRIANGWKCRCELRLAEFELENRIDRFMGNREIVNPDGEKVEEGRWACVIVCPSCELVHNMDPEDYHLLAGAELFMQWKDSEGGIYKAQKPMEIRDFADAGIMGLALGSTLMGTDEKVPPWMWGTYCVYLPSGLQGKREG